MPSLPWFKFEAQRWRSDGKLQKCKAEGIAVWIQALTWMHVEDTYELEGDIEELAMALNLPAAQVEEGIRQLDKARACEVIHVRPGVVTLVSRKRRREYEEREKARIRKQKQRFGDEAVSDGEGGHADVTPDVTEPSLEHTRARALSSLSSSSEAVEASKGRVGSPRERLADSGDAGPELERPTWAPSEDSVVQYFLETGGLGYNGDHKAAELDARLFWTHYEDKDWLDDADRPLRKWRITAKRWMLRTQRGDFAPRGGAGKKAEATGDPLANIPDL